MSPYEVAVTGGGPASYLRWVPLPRRPSVAGAAGRRQAGGGELRRRDRPWHGHRTSSRCPRLPGHTCRRAAAPSATPAGYHRPPRRTPRHSWGPRPLGPRRPGLPLLPRPPGAGRPTRSRRDGCVVPPRFVANHELLTALTQQRRHHDHPTRPNGSADQAPARPDDLAGGLPDPYRPEPGPGRLAPHALARGPHLRAGHHRGADRHLRSDAAAAPGPWPAPDSP